MPPNPPEDAPRLTAWIDTDAEDDQLHISVSEDGTEYERVDSDIGILMENRQYIASFENAILTLLTLRQRTIEADGDSEAPIEEDPAAVPQGGD